jgi:hypothetical protein
VVTVPVADEDEIRLNSFGEREAAGFPSRNGSITSLYPPVSSPDAACPYQVNLVVIRTPFISSIGKIITKINYCWQPG